MTELSLSPPLFSIFTTLVEERVGLSYRLVDQPIFESKLSACMLDAGFESALDYYYFLRYDDKDRTEFQTLVQALVVHETFFFRELTPLRAVIDAIIQPLVMRGQTPRVWCAACSTGEEPLSLAMLLADMDLLDKVRICASDISEKALLRALSGTFGARAVREQLPTCARRFLEATTAGYRIAPELIHAITWRELNLLDEPAVAALGEMDLILCRNVLIYFSDDTARRVVTRLAHTLSPNGALLVGVSESLMRFQAGLACEEYGGAFLYRKAAQ